jgi:transcriptional regulator with XRE-family HTH domain
MSETLGDYLKEVRKKRQFTLRNVEEEIKISNAYLSQLENGKIISPSPVILNKLAKYYRISYEKLMNLAGYPVPPKPDIVDDRPKFRMSNDFKDITQEETKKLMEYLEFLRSKKR